jgi:hypothetical protein
MNNKWLVMGLSVAAVVLLAGLAVGAYAFTQRPFGQVNARGGMMAGPGVGGMVDGRGGMLGQPGLGGMLDSRGEMIGGRGPRFDGAQDSLVTIAAQDFNIQASDLFAALQSGKTIADIAKEKNVSTDKIVNDYIAARTASLKTAVDAKQITQAQADAMLALAKANAAQELTQTWNTRVNAFGGQNSPMQRGDFGGRGGGMMNQNGGWK